MDKIDTKSDKENLLKELTLLRKRVTELEEFKKHNGRLNDIFSSLKDLVFVLDRDGVFTEFYAPSEELYLPPEDFIGRKYFDVMPPHLNTLFSKAFKKNKNGKVDEYSYTLEMAGKQQWYYAKQSPLFTEGQFAGAVAVIRNITEHKQLDEKLKETEDRYRTLIELGNKIGEAVIMLQDINGKEGIHTYVSAQWPQITGYSKKELLGMSFFGLVSPQFRGASLKRHRTRMHGKTIPDLFESAITRKDGAEISIELTSAVTIYKNKPTNVVYIRDITERKNMQAELKKYHSYLEEIIEERTRELEETKNELERKIKEYEDLQDDMNFMMDNIPLCLIIKDKNGRFLRMDKRSRDSLMPADVIGKTVYDIPALDRDYCDFENRCDQQVIETGEPQEVIFSFKADNRQGLRRSSTGQPKEVQFNVGAKIRKSAEKWRKIVRIPHKDKNGNVDQFILLSFDINDIKYAEKEINRLYNEEKRLRKKLEKQMEQKRDFIRSLVHELKTPLVPLIGASSMLADNLGEEARQNAARVVLTGAHKLEKRIDELLDQTRLELGTMNLSLGQVDAEKLLIQIFDYMQYRAANKKQVFKLDIPSSLPEIWADEDRLGQVIVNLLENAFRYTPEKGLITLGASCSNNELIIYVRDNGIGISNHRQKNIFLSYNRVSSKKDKLSGLGLGLNLCKMLIELHGGSIWVESQKGKGSVFSFTMPLKSETKDNIIIKGASL